MAKTKIEILQDNIIALGGFVNYVRNHNLSDYFVTHEKLLEEISKISGNIQPLPPVDTDISVMFYDSGFLDNVISSFIGNAPITIDKNTIDGLIQPDFGLDNVPHVGWIDIDDPTAEYLNNEISWTFEKSTRLKPGYSEENDTDKLRSSLLSILNDVEVSGANVSSDAIDIINTMHIATLSEFSAYIYDLAENHPEYFEDGVLDELYSLNKRGPSTYETYEALGRSIRDNIDLNNSNFKGSCDTLIGEMNLCAGCWFDDEPCDFLNRVNDTYGNFKSLADDICNTVLEQLDYSSLEGIEKSIAFSHGFLKDTVYPKTILETFRLFRLAMGLKPGLSAEHVLEIDIPAFRISAVANIYEFQNEVRSARPNEVDEFRSAVDAYTEEQKREAELANKGAEAAVECVVRWLKSLGIGTMAGIAAAGLISTGVGAIVFVIATALTFYILAPAEELQNYANAHPAQELNKRANDYSGNGIFYAETIYETAFTYFSRILDTLNEMLDDIQSKVDIVRDTHDYVHTKKPDDPGGGSIDYDPDEEISFYNAAGDSLLGTATRNELMTGAATPPTPDPISFPGVTYSFIGWASQANASDVEYSDPIDWSTVPVDLFAVMG